MNEENKAPENVEVSTGQPLEDTENTTAPEGAEQPEGEGEPETTLDEEAKEDEAAAAASAPTAPSAEVVAPDQAPEGDHLAVINAAGDFKYVMEREAAIERAKGGGHFVRVPSEEELKAFLDA